MDKGIQQPCEELAWLCALRTSPLGARPASKSKVEPSVMAYAFTPSTLETDVCVDL